LHGESFLISFKLCWTFNLFGLIQAPLFQLIVENFKILGSLGVHAPFNLFLMAFFFVFLKFQLAGEQLSILVILRLPKLVCSHPGKPSANSALNKETDLFALFRPHVAREVLAGVNDFVITTVDEKTRGFHLAALLTHHVSRLGLVLVSLDLALELVRVVVGDLIGLGESVVEGNSWAVVSETAEVGLGTLLLVNSDSDDFDLVIGHPDFYLKFVWHHELISLDWVVIIWLLLLFFSFGVFSLHLFLLLLLLLLLVVLYIVIKISQLAWLTCSPSI
jgi:hypothetical protein